MTGRSPVDRLRAQQISNGLLYRIVPENRGLRAQGAVRRNSADGPEARAGCAVSRKGSVQNKDSQGISHGIATLIMPAAGQGLRLLPATKAIPKELLPYFDRRALQFAIDEAIELGVAGVVMVIHPAKRGIREYLAPDAALVAQLRVCDKTSLAAALIEIEVPAEVDVVFVEQDQPLGLGHAVLLPDDLVFGRSCLPEMAESYAGGHMIAAMEVAPDEACAYGTFRLQTPAIGRMVAVSGMVEKPQPGLTPSRLAAVGRYILDPGIFATLRHVARAAGSEI